MKQLLFFNSRDNLLRLDIERIVYFEANGNYTYVISKNKLKQLVTISLSKMEEALTAQLAEGAAIFMRVGKRFIINRNFIYSIDTAHQRLCLSDMDSFAFLLPVSSAALRKVKELIISKRV